MKNLIELPVSELKTALAGLNKIVSKSTSLPVLRSIRVNRSSEGRVILEATDLDTAACYETVNQQPNAACEVLVPIETLTKAVKNSASNSRIALLKESKTALTLRTFIGENPVDQKIETLEPKEWPPVPRAELPPIILDQKLREAVTDAMECSSEEATRAALQGAWIDPSDPQAHYVLGTDGRHLFTANSFCLDLKEAVLLPNKKFVQWSGFKEDGDWKLSLMPAKTKDEQAWLQLQSDHWTFLSRRQDATCPNWRQAVPSPTDAKTILQFSEASVEFLQQLLPKLPGNDDINRGITLDVTKTLTVKAHARGSSDWTSVVVPEVKITGKPNLICLNRDYLLKALSFGLHNLDLYDELSPMVFSTAGKRMVVMPIRLEATAPVPQPEAQVAEPAKESATATPNPETPTTERNTMPKATETQTAETAESPVKSLVQHIETIKESLKGVVRDLNDLLDLVKKTEKEKKASEKEIEAVREKLREIQSVKI
ncbi:hypothetical protein NXS98_06165 [Fontisphaera persica]|uniref:hypothetical protein n=1 Tax=Fontisphaera persica TaxID=2974023 RepID=UPI0024BF771C|nr:hypothetical protein [Fontisphaera persica]WCJ60709.1 hypothetical protein NXS98_06165 [Fontisphaera persica]